MDATLANAKHSTESAEHYTPSEIVEAARAVMGNIDLDPASTAFVNKNLVKAVKYYTVRTNGFSKQWEGNVFLNPPGGLCDSSGRKVIRATRSHGAGCTETGACGLPAGHTHEGVTSSAKAWWFKLAKEWVEGRVNAAIFVGFSLELLQSTQIKGDHDSLPIPLMFPRCYVAQRIKFLTQEGTKLVPGEQPTHGNVIVYLPGKKDGWDIASQMKMRTHFIKFGHVEWAAPAKRAPLAHT